MSDFDMPLKTSKYSLGNHKLELDPELDAQIRRLISGESAPGFRQLILNPKWQNYSQKQLSAIPPAQKKQPPKLKAGPSTPKPAEVGDLMKAIWKTPAVKKAVDQVATKAETHFRRDWKRANTGDRAGLITATTFFTAATMTGIMVNKPSRDLLLDFVSDRPLSVPGVPGLTLKMLAKGRGAGMQIKDIAGTGLNIKGSAKASSSGGADWNVHLSFDLTSLVPALR